MKAKMCKVLSLTLAMVLAFTLIPARELAASTNEDASTDTVQTEEEAPADTAKDDKAEKPSDDKEEEPAEKAPAENSDDSADKVPAENNDDPEEKKQDEEKDVQQDNKQPEENPDEVAETTSATPDEDKKAPEPKNANQNRGTGDNDELAFVTQPKGGTVEPQSYLKIEWETNFSPWRVEVGYLEGGQFKSVKEVTRIVYSYDSYKQVSLSKEYYTELYYGSAVTSDEWILRAYLNENEDSPFADSAKFSITKGALKFVTQPKGGTVEPQSTLNFSWETNFDPWRIEVGYLDGGQFKVVKEITKKEYSYVYGEYIQVSIARKNNTNLSYSDAVTTDKWILRAYLNENEDSPSVDSAKFSITKGALKFVEQPEGGTVEPQSTLNLSWQTNFDPWRIEVGYLDGGQFKVVKELTKKEYIYVYGEYIQVSMARKNNTNLSYSDAVTTDKWILRAYLNENEDFPSVDSRPFTIIKAVYSGTCGNNLNWSYEDGALTIDGTGAMYNYDDTVAGSAPWHWLTDEITTVELSSEITSIGNYAFADLLKLNSVTIPEKVTTIGSHAFKGCKSLKSIVIPDTVRMIGEYAFYKAGLQSVTISSNIMLIPTGAFAENDLRNVTIPSGIVQINSNAFASNPNLWKVTFPSSLGSIGDCAFANCRINEIVLPDGLRSIGEGAFINNKTVWGIKFPDSVTNIGARAFADCTALQRLEFEGGAPNIGSNAFSNVTAKAYYVVGLNGWDSSTLKNYGGTITWVGLQTCSEDGKLTWSLRDGVLTISGTGYMIQYLSGNKPGWYEDRDKIKSIIIMPGVARIGSHAFDDCTNVNTIIFYGSKPSFGFTPFTGVTANAYYTPDETWTNLPNYSDATITWIESNGQCGDNLFWRIDENKIIHITGTGDMYDYPGNFSLPWYKWADDIVGVEIASGCTSIGEGAFYSCSKIESVTMPSTVKTIGKNAFYRCSRLSSINLSSSLTNIGESAFYYCYALSEITIPDKVTVIDETAFMGCSSLKSVVIPDSVVTLGLRAFAQCSSLEYVEIGKGVTVIPGSAFSSCKNLASVEFSGDVTAIYNYAFMGCSSLDYIELPAALKELGMSAFSNCTSLSRIKIHDKLESLDYGVFSGCSALSEAFFYGTPEQWDAVTKGSSNTALINIVRCVRAEGDCSKNDSTEYSDVMWRLFWDGELRISGFGKMNSYESPNFASDSNKIAPWNEFKDDITCVIIEEGVTNVGSFAFYNFTNLKSAILPEGINSIENFAFAFCGFTTLKLPDTITEIQGHAFVNCSNLESIVIPDGVQEISEGTFFRCKALTTVTIPESVTKIGKEAFRECVALTEITIPSNVTIINNYAFDSCTGLEKVELNEGLKTINDSAFSNCSSLKEIVIPSTVTYIGNKGFSKCTSLKTVIFTGNAPLISTNRSFENVSTYAYYPATDSTWTESVRQDYGGTIKWVPLGEGDIILKFSHNCSFGNNLAVGFYIPKAEVEGFENYRLVVKKQVFNASGSSFTWNETTLTDYIVEVQGGVEYYKFVYRGLAACEMGDELNATLYMEKDGNTYNTTPDIYSIKEYIYNRLKYSGDNTFKRLIVDMLNYGAAAQKYFNYNSSASHLVNADLTDEQKAYQTTVLNAESAAGTDKTEGATARIIGKMVVFGNSTELKYFMQFDSGAPNDNVKLVLSYVAVNGETYTTTINASDFAYDSTYKAYTAKITSISAADMSSVITAKIYDGDTLISDVVYYSIETYVYNRLEKSTDEAFKELARAMLIYGKSAKAYFLHE